VYLHATAVLPFEHFGYVFFCRCGECSFQTPSKATFSKHVCSDGSGVGSGGGGEEDTDGKAGRHSGRRMKCDHCDKEFRSKVGLNLHNRLHLGGEGVHRVR
jgi:hypothetical protein